jgi:hypothetical protein
LRVLTDVGVGPTIKAPLLRPHQVVGHQSVAQSVAFTSLANSLTLKPSGTLGV